MRSLLLARHAHSEANERGVANGVPPGDGLTERGVGEATALGSELATENVTLAVTTELRRTQQTAALALSGRDVPTVVLPALNEIHVGLFEGDPVQAYLDWAWSSPPDLECPGGGESRAAAVGRVAGAVEGLLGIADETVLVITHGVVVRWILDAAAGDAPRARLRAVGFAEPHRLTVPELSRAAGVLSHWAASPRFADAPNGD